MPWAPATGLISTAADLARFFASLDPAAKRSVLSPTSRREMIRRQWHDPHPLQSTYYGLGITSGQVGNWDWFGHGGGFQGTLTRTFTLPGQDLAVSILTNASDGFSGPWGDGVIRILQTLKAGGAPRARTRDWAGRWWTLWGAVDLVPCADHVRIAHARYAEPVRRAHQDRCHGAGRGHPVQVQRLRQPGRGRPAGAQPQRQGSRSLARRNPLPARRSGSRLELKRRYDT